MHMLRLTGMVALNVLKLTSSSGMESHECVGFLDHNQPSACSNPTVMVLQTWNHSKHTCLCYPTQVNVSSLTSARKPGTQLTSPGGRDL